MPIPGMRFGTTRQEGDDTFVTFFLVFLISVILVASFIIAPRNSDDMVDMVPRSAVLYAHARGEAVMRLGPMLPTTLAGLTPDEVAVFAVESAGQIGLNWGYLLKWNNENADSLSLRYPVLADLPRRGNDKIFVMADPAAARSMELVRLGGSLADDASVSSALKKARSFSGNQMYVQPAGAQAIFGSGDTRLGDPQMVLWRSANRLVFASLDGITPEISALAIPVSEDKYQALGWAGLTVFGNVRESRAVLANLILGPNWSESGAVMVLSGNRLMDMLSEADYLAVGLSEKSREHFLAHVNGDNDQVAK